MSKPYHKTTEGGNERAQESADPRPIGQDCSVGDIPQNELKSEDEGQQGLRSRVEKLETAFAELQREQRLESQRLSERLERLEGFLGRVKRFIRRLFNVRFLIRCWNESEGGKKGPTDAHSGLTFPEEKVEAFNRCWFALYADLPHVLELNELFVLLPACSTADDFVNSIRQFADKNPSICRNLFIRSREGISLLISLVDHPDNSFKNFKSIVRRVRDCLDKLGHETPL